MIGVAGELAAAKAEGPGSFAVAILDALYNLDGPTLIARGKGELMDVDLRLYALVDPAVAGGRTLADLAALIAGSATLVQLRDKHGSHPRHGRGSARAAARAGAGRRAAADQRPRRCRARRRSRRRAYRPGRHGARRRAAAARPHRHHRAEHQARCSRRRPRRSSCSTMSASAAVFATSSKDDRQSRRSALRACATSCRRSVRARAGISDLRHRRHQCRQRRPR